MPRKGEENIVQGGTVQSELVYLHPRRVEVADDGGEKTGPAGYRRPHVPALGVDAHPTVTVGVTFENRGGLLNPSPRATVISSRSPPTRALSSAEVPSAITRPRVDDGDPVGEPVRLIEVLRRE